MGTPKAGLGTSTRPVEVGPHELLYLVQYVPLPLNNAGDLFFIFTQSIPPTPLNNAHFGRSFFWRLIIFLTSGRWWRLRRDSNPRHVTRVRIPALYPAELRSQRIPTYQKTIALQNSQTRVPNKAPPNKKPLISQGLGSLKQRLRKPNCRALSIDFARDFSVVCGWNGPVWYPKSQTTSKRHAEMYGAP